MLEVTGLQAAYGKIRALHGVTLRVEEHAIVAVLGANGAGKTTLLRCISGLIKPQGGGVSLEGRNLAGLEPERIVTEGISQVPEGRLIFSSLTVRENLLMGGFRGRKPQVSEGIERVCGYFPVLGERMHQRAGTLSGGEQQMLAIARALVLTPRVLLLDEPSMGIAPLVKQQIFDTLLRIRDRERTTILIVEQDADVALGICDYAYVLETGRVVMEGKGETLAGDEKLRRAYLGG
jgi:branched-chain amino acid transport system ATP-binding protein